MSEEFNLGRKRKRGKIEKQMRVEIMENQAFFFPFLASPVSSQEPTGGGGLVLLFTPLRLGLKLPWKHPSCWRVSRVGLTASERSLLWLCICLIYSLSPFFGCWVGPMCKLLAALYPSAELVWSAEKAGIFTDMLGPHYGGNCKAGLSEVLAKRLSPCHVSGNAHTLCWSEEGTLFFLTYI